MESRSVWYLPQCKACTTSLGLCKTDGAEQLWSAWMKKNPTRLMDTLALFDFFNSIPFSFKFDIQSHSLVVLWLFLHLPQQNLQGWNVGSFFKWSLGYMRVRSHQAQVMEADINANWDSWPSSESRRASGTSSKRNIVGLNIDVRSGRVQEASQALSVGALF